MERCPRPLASGDQTLAHLSRDAAGLGHFRCVFERSRNPKPVANSCPSLELALAGGSAIVHAGISPPSIGARARLRSSAAVSVTAEFCRGVRGFWNSEILLRPDVYRGLG